MHQRQEHQAHQGQQEQRGLPVHREQQKGQQHARDGGARRHPGLLDREHHRADRDRHRLREHLRTRGIDQAVRNAEQKDAGEGEQDVCAAAADKAYADEDRRKLEQAHRTEARDQRTARETEQDRRDIGR